MSLKYAYILIGVLIASATLNLVNAQGLSTGEGLKLVAAGLAFGLAAVGAGLAIGYSGAASIAVVAEKPGMRAWSFIILGLSEALAIYGLVIAFLLIFT
ncbi:MAG: ATP synthase subunit C [Thermoproteota archaeon]|jgi:V/A-type H+-transporting ATPase subunit K|nr:ATP synthase subunit C [Thermoproteota archaeon]